MAQSVVKNKRDFRMLRLNKDGFAPQKIMYISYKTPPYLSDLSGYSWAGYGRKRRSSNFSEKLTPERLIRQKRQNSDFNFVSGVEKFSYKATFERPPDGYWKAYFIELEFI